MNLKTEHEEFLTPDDLKYGVNVFREDLVGINGHEDGDCFPINERAIEEDQYLIRKSIEKVNF
jgi:hypothetical protein